MDQHPIPQDVTGFQFKLIGTMTVKQFGFVASGVIMAVILYYLPIAGPFAIIIKVLLIPILGASGVVISFVPIEGRPVDVMTSNFVKALFSPNQYIYHRQGRKLSFSAISDAKPVVAKKVDPKAPVVVAQSHAKQTTSEKEAKLRALLLGSHGGGKTAMDVKEDAFLKTLALPAAPAHIATAVPQATAAPARPVPIKQAAVAQKPAPVVHAAIAPSPVSTPVKLVPVVATSAPVVQPAQPSPQSPPPNPEMLEKQETQLATQLEQAKQEEAQSVAPEAHTAAHQKVATLATQIDQIHAQKQQLEQELAKLKTQLSEQKNAAPIAPAPVATAQAVDQAPAPIPAPIAKPAIPIQDPKLVRIVPKSAEANRTDLPRVSDTPNVVIGIVKDPRGNVLANILVEVKDKEGNPVRAFKTNPLGQFASATPLSPGTYTMELEDPKKLQKFDVIQITANNQIMRPIEIISHDAREELRQQLFS